MRGKFFNHLADFLKERKARIKLELNKGDWKDSTSGSSAGTVLGPILFVAYVMMYQPMMYQPLPSAIQTRKSKTNAKGT